MNVVFHHTDDDSELHARVTGNIGNLLDDETIATDDVALVSNGGGIALLIEDSPEREAVEDLQERGVVFKQCSNTLTDIDTTENDLIDGVELVSSGVGEIARLEAAGYVYITP
ncbi:DsrE family protein [Halococcus dombrowskii]|uniref:DsrE family protein n=1 Tax=Halococcus dombrowskii TaxID=179637 RepID=A0AAV3SHA8_HALDO|nr:DsrE family protein [Halococcus dombrowskii]UOO95292.1 DsrE family protein [Halococcus dombrowskii]